MSQTTLRVLETFAHEQSNPTLATCRVGFRFRSRVPN
jgi:hypothetical protein